ncbi:SDR family NAD(P)-dependent oxidoreductase [Herbiconiux sp. KACC 21604]|uniref:SDR family NAD(P)-dependent oxidoreductase n=1 Tax=unclassified Herbiconiux TaxID=2618217 RepID=UPI001492F126|nr:SDR family NAD(P)-dependent oxidoreductase [Herbiconiux sp. SALV-R1]QJU55688.1 SDR family NAD(P)-dependent oxidoreductase [Herbiconiux sp. SALV-R1]WPO86891.1 SDR family NAD(P)-dependent oxidoreductase [Herbiconiux sp. KACC 21604]
MTGGTAGNGFFIAEGLARLGAEVVITGRSRELGEAARALLPRSGAHRFVRADLADPESIAEAADHLGQAGRLDALVMNAGVVAAPPTLRIGPFGVESTVATNVLGHADLLRRVMPVLDSSPDARVVSVGSMLTRRIGFDRANWLAQESYRPRVAYAMSRHAAEIYGFELDRRLRASGSTIRSVVTHPGGAIDALTPDRPGVHERSVGLRGAARVLGPLFRRLVHGKDAASHSAILAVAAADLPPGAYIGPSRVASGEPILTEPVPSSRDASLGAWLWEEISSLLPEL